MMMMKIKTAIVDLDKVTYFSYSTRLGRLFAHFSSEEQDMTSIECTQQEYEEIAKKIEVRGQSNNAD